MSQNEAPPKDTSSTIMSAFLSGKNANSGTLFKEDEFDIYVNKTTLEAYIFHAPEIPHDIARLEYNPKDHSVTVVKKDGTQMDLGAKLQWLVRSYFIKAQEVNIVQTKDGKIVDGFIVPLIHKT